MKSITLKAMLHRGQECIALLYTWDSAINTIVKKIPAIKWSRTHSCWYLPLSREFYNTILKHLKEKATIDDTALKAYLQKRRQVAATLPLAANNKTTAIKPSAPAWQLSPQNLIALEKLTEQLKLKAYSASTIKTYRNEFLQLLQTLKNKPVKDLTADDLRRYMVYAMEKQGIKENTAHSRLNALKFYFEQVLKHEKLFLEIPRPKKRSQLPKIFNQDEVAAIINSVQNKKHKTMLMMAYSAGMRVSEVVALKTYNIDSKQMSILIEQAKGKKDRIVTLSPVLLVMLREYALQYTPAKKGYLFEGSAPNTPYSVRSLQEVIQAAKKKAGVMKPGSIHSLRHSFATHLLEKGTDISMIQKLLGHNDIKTTLLYLHTTNKDLVKVISPLDDLALN